MTSKKYKKGFVWLRRDIRLSDHTALMHAEKLCDEIIPVFVFDELILGKLKNKKDRRLTFIVKSLKEIFKKLDGHFLVLHGDPQKLIPEKAQLFGVGAVFTNRDYESYAKKRDLGVKEALKKCEIDFYSYQDQVIFEGPEVKTSTNSFYKVFTPFKNQWLQKLKPQHIQEAKVHGNCFSKDPRIQKESIPLKYEKIGFHPCELWLKPGEVAAQERFQEFLEELDRYHIQRDFPALPHGTSGLSVHLRFGTISIRELVRTVLSMKKKTKGMEVWISELVWRDFYHMILDCFPHVEFSAFKPEYKDLEWPGKKEHFQAWCAGQTGYPIVDAAMRQLNETGWMHNRLRMIAASFLVKDLLIDWKWGEAYFAEHLLDFDLAANNGGWQWCASTGCDAQPYFRIFNPVSQSKKFDEKGEFIKKYVPELKKFSEKEIHWPHESGGLFLNHYPDPIVVHDVQRMKAIRLFQIK